MSSRKRPAGRLSLSNPHRTNTRAPGYLIPILKLPVILYRLGMGCLLGHRFMYLKHLGRRSGKVRGTVLAVLRFDPSTSEIMAVSAWSASDWHKNIQAAPALQVETGFTCYVPLSRSLTSDEIAALFEEYRRKRPIFSRIVCRIPGWKWDSSPRIPRACTHAIWGSVPTQKD
jgi:deazaflavin-dependent oxidoreductase (nitroreductase family)